MSAIYPAVHIVFYLLEDCELAQDFDACVDRQTRKMQRVVRRLLTRPIGYRVSGSLECRHATRHRVPSRTQVSVRRKSPLLSRPSTMAFCV